MKHRMFATLQSIVFRVVLLGIMLSMFTMSNMSVVHAQKGTIRTSIPESGIAPGSEGTVKFIDVANDEDCEDEDGESLNNTAGSDGTDCLPPVRVTRVWTADGSLNPKTSFLFGEPIQWVIMVKNTKSHAASVQITYDVREPSGALIRHSESTVSVKAGVSLWPLSGTVPDVAGKYSFTGSVNYRGSISHKTTTYNVSAPCYTLATNSSPGVGGTVSASPAPDCNGGTQYSSGVVVTLTANANTGYSFSAWSGDLTGSTNPTAITMTGNASVTANFVEFTGLIAGTYDDTDPAWSYTGDWSTETNANDYGGSQHTSTTVGDQATVTMNGSQFTLYFSEGSNNGNLDVYVDNIKIDTINEYNTTTTYQNTWISPALALGIHTLEFVHLDGAAVNIDAIQICSASGAVSAGTYDDTDCNWIYSGAWSIYTGNGPANNTMHYTGAMGDYAELLFHGTKFILTFTKAAPWGSLDVYVDGAKITTINAYNPIALWQQTYASPTFADGDHTVRIVHAGGGTYIDVDAIQICPVAGVVPVGTYDDNDCNWTYSGTWTAWSGTGPYANTMHYTGTVGDYAELQFHGTRFNLIFTKAAPWGSLDVYVDGTKITTINAYNPVALWQQTYASPAYPIGDHTVRLVHAGGGTYIDVDGIQIFDSPPPVTTVSYDDADTNWTYSGSWTAYTGSGPANNTMHYTGTAGSYAELQFHGTKFNLTFTKSSAYGSIDVYVDGSKIDTINAYSPTTLWQQTYSSPAFAEGDHTVRLVHAGGGSYIDIDAIQVCSGSGAAPAGTYDDNDCNWTYSGTWIGYTGSGPANNTMHYTGTAGSYAELLFHGTKFTLTFTRSSAYGSIDVYVDGSKVDTINAYSPMTVWQQSYTSPVFTDSDHTVRLVHAGGGTYVDVDAIQIE